jgi:hypothetical protein
MSGLNVCPVSTRWGSGLGKLAGVFSCYVLCPLSWMLFVGHLPGWCQRRHHASLVPKRSRADSTEQDCCCLGPCKVFCWMVCQWGTWQLMLQVFCDIVWNISANWFACGRPLPRARREAFSLWALDLGNVWGMGAGLCWNKKSQWFLKTAGTSP